MKSKSSVLPSTGRVLDFFFTSCGLSKGKDSGHDYQRIRRLVAESKQSDAISDEVKASLFDAVCGLFTSRRNRPASKSIADAPEAHTRRIRAFRHAFGEIEPQDFGHCLLNLLGEFLLRNEWFCQQQPADAEPDALRWKWIVDWANVHYTNTLCDFATFRGGVRDSLPWDLSWNLPLRLPDGTVKWPIGHAMTWWEDLLGVPLSPSEQNSSSIVSSRSLNRYRSHCHAPSLDTIELWAKQKWAYRGTFNPAGDTDIRIRWRRWLAFREAKSLNPASLYAAIGPIGIVESERWLESFDPFPDELPVAEFLDKIQRRYAQPSPQRLRAVLLWCRALQAAFAEVKAKHSIDAVWTLTDWSRQCTDTMGRFQSVGIEKFGSVPPVPES